MNYSLRSLSDVKLCHQYGIADKSVRKVDGFRVRLDAIRVLDGFNERIPRDQLREHVASIAGALAAGERVQDLEVAISEDGTLELVDGHCTYEGYRLYAEQAGDAFDGWVSAKEFKGTMAQRKARIVTSNRQLPLLPLEMGRVYKSLRDEFGYSRQQIASEVAKSLAHVDQMLKLVDGDERVQGAVEAGEISAAEAVKLIRDHGDDAAEELERRKELAAEAGSSKVTAKVAPKKSAAPKMVGIEHFVSVAAQALVESLANAEEILGGGLEQVSVSALLMADLITCVREMHEAAKPLDNDKQQEMEL
jgi:hypothetical protein